MSTVGARVSTEIRSLATHAERRACVALQRMVWGPTFTEGVSSSILGVAPRVGGVSAGAFRDDTLVGFVFGMTGLQRGRLVHWSHILAVRPDLQGQGIGRELKHWQREAVTALGVEVMQWTFDPLVARNAHLNINVLGARPSEYVPDMYDGTLFGVGSDSGGLDRLLVEWNLAADVRPRAARVHEHFLREPVVNPIDPATMRPTLMKVDRLAGDRLRIAVPFDPVQLRSQSDLALAWRVTTRAAFQAAAAEGFEVVGFSSGSAELAHYLLARRAPR